MAYDYPGRVECGDELNNYLYETVAMEAADPNYAG